MTNKLKQPIRKVFNLAPQLLGASVMIACMYVGMFAYVRAGVRRNKR